MDHAPSNTPPDSAKTPRPLTIVLTGGGTGGHITPIIAVAHELKQLQPSLRIGYIGERHGKFQELVKDNPDIDETYTIFAGKFRRYHGESIFTRLFAIKTNLLNLRDAFFVLFGFLQSFRNLRKLKPDMILLKGGYVGMPVGLAAAVQKRKFITHDSDALPGLANRLVSRWATYHATGMPASYYSYDEKSVRHVGVLMAQDYQPVTPVIQKQFKIDLGISPSSKVLLVTGGSLGARVINLAMVKLAPQLLEHFPDIHILHQVGKGNARVYGEYKHPHLQILEFLNPMYKYTGTADVVVTRAGANTLAELGVQGRACILVPNPLLTGGHQLKNAEYLLQQEAAKVVDEAKLNDDSNSLMAVITELLQDSTERNRLGQKLQSLTIPDAAHKLAELLLETAD